MIAFCLWNKTVLCMMNYFNHKNTQVWKLKWVKLLLMNAANSSDTNPTKVPSIPVHVENSMGISGFIWTKMFGKVISLL